MTVRPMTGDDRDAVVALRRESFNAPPAVVERQRAMPVDNQFVWDEDGTLLATAVYYDMSFFFGGRSVPASGVAGVVVAPHARGRRLAEEVVGHIVRQTRATHPLSSLYPATVPIYRRLGYEFAAQRTRYKVPIAALPRFDGALDVEPWTDDHIGEVAVAHRRLMSESNATLDRTDDWWRKRVVSQWDERRPVYRYLVREGGEVTGSAVYTQENDWEYTVECRDLFWSTPASARALLTFFARQSSLGRGVEWFGPPADPIMLLVAQDHVRRDTSDQIQYPMFRLSDVPAAIEQRGYDPDVRASITIEVDDPLVGENRGPWRISVVDGKASVEPAGDAAIKAGAGALAAIYTGFLQPFDARRAGAIEADAAGVAALTRVFGGPLPWASDFF